MPTAQKAAALQPVSKDAIERLDHKMFRRLGLEHLGELGTVLEDTFKVEFIERNAIEGDVLPWDGIPDDFVLARYTAYVIPKEGS